jgi:large subunit ribosomal protein L2
MINPFKFFKPYTPGVRNTRLLNKNNLLKRTKPLKKYIVGGSFGTGRNHHGVITNWNIGGRHKRRYRHIDFFRRNEHEGIIEGFEHDPNRNTQIIRTFNPDQHFHGYILKVCNIIPGDCLRNYTGQKKGTHIFLRDIPIGDIIHNLSHSYQSESQYLRAAGAYGQIIVKSKKFVRVKLKSGEHRIFAPLSSATLGIVGTENIKFIKLGKAGRNRWLGKRPSVRGVAINPVDHPHGGGEGKTSGGRPSVTPWGKITKSQPTTKTFNYVRVQLRNK